MVKFFDGKKPILVWLIFLWFMYSGTFGFIYYLSLVNNPEALSAPHSAYFKQLSTIDHLFAFITTWSVGIPSILLFLLKKISSKLFLVSIVVAIFSVTYHLLFKDWGEVELTVFQTYSPIISIIIPIAIYLYSLRLISKGVIK